MNCRNEMNAHNVYFLFYIYICIMCTSIGTHAVSVRCTLYILYSYAESSNEGIIIASKICIKTTLVEYINVEHELIDLQRAWIEPLAAAVLGCSIRRCNVRRRNREDACGHRSYLFIHTNAYYC